MSARPSRSRPKVVTVVGARPQFIKAAALGRANRTAGLIDEVLVHTGQHYDDALSARFFRDLDIAAPKVNLAVGSGSQGAQTAAMLSGIEHVLLEEAPDAVLVYGDTNSTLAAALAAAKLHVPIAHVEAGLRSFNRAMPEEVNRVVTDHCATWCFAPSQRAVEQLAREGIVQGVHQVGDIMLDALQHEMASLSADDEVVSVARGHDEGVFAVATVHRAASTDDPAVLARLVRALDAIAREQLPVVLPLHPRTRAALERDGLQLRHVRAVAPLGHRDLLGLVERAAVVVTDSGGLQKEAMWLKTPCVTLREETEWVETVEAGWNTLVGTDEAAVLAAVLRRPTPSSTPTPYGDGTAAERVLGVLVDALG